MEKKDYGSNANPADKDQNPMKPPRAGQEKAPTSQEIEEEETSDRSEEEETGSELERDRNTGGQTPGAGQP